MRPAGPDRAQDVTSGYSSRAVLGCAVKTSDSCINTCSAFDAAHRPPHSIEFTTLLNTSAAVGQMQAGGHSVGPVRPAKRLSQTGARQQTPGRWVSNRSSHNAYRVGVR